MMCVTENKHQAKSEEYTERPECPSGFSATYIYTLASEYTRHYIYMYGDRTATTFTQEFEMCIQ